MSQNNGSFPPNESPNHEMTIRTGISDAPTVTLGEGGRQQLLPVLEVFPTSEKRPGKTTVGDMADFFQGGGTGFAPEIQRLYVNDSAGIRLRENGHQAPGTFSEAVTVPVQKEADSLIAGSLDFYTITQGRIAFTTSGAYRLTGRLYTTANGTGQTIDGETAETNIDFEGQGEVPGQQLEGDFEVNNENVQVRLDVEEVETDISGSLTVPILQISSQNNAPTFMGVVLLTNIGRTQIVYGETIAFQTSNPSRTYLFADFSAIFRAEVNAELELGAQVYNNGSAITTGNSATFDFVNSFRGAKADLLIERLSL